METAAFGDSQGPFLWTTKSLRNLEADLQKPGYQVKYREIGSLLKNMGYSLQSNQKMNRADDQHPDRDAQFRHINEAAQSYIQDGYPVIFVECKKKENIGNFKNTAQNAPLKINLQKRWTMTFLCRNQGKLRHMECMTLSQTRALSAPASARI